MKLLRVLLRNYQKLSIPIYISISFIIIFFVGVYDVFDSFAYLNIGNYLLVDHWYSVSPWNVQIPQTLYGPIYPMICVFFLRHDNPMRYLGIPFTQMLFLSIASYAVLKISNKFFTAFWRTVSVTIFLLLPFNLLYATFLMSESISISLMCIYLWIVVSLSNKNPKLYGVLVLTQCIMILTKYAFQALIPITLFLFIRYIYQQLKLKKFLFIDTVINIFLVGISIACIFSWMSFNYAHYNSWQLTSMSGRHLYAGPVYRARLLPPKDNLIYKEFLKKLENENLFYDPPHKIEWIFEEDFKAHKITEIEVDHKFGILAKEAILAHIPQYVLFVAKNLITIPLSTPITTPTRLKDVPSIIYNYDYNPYGPYIFNEQILQVYFSIIDISIKTHYPLTIALLFLAFIGITRAVIRKEKVLLKIIIVCIPLYLLFSLVATDEGRYFIIFYGIYALLITYALEGITMFMRRLYKNLNNT